jgi:hypothetical protein
LLPRVARALTPFFNEILAVVGPVLARILAIVVPVVPGVVVHVNPAVPAIRSVVVVVVDRCAHRDTGGESNQASSDRLGIVIVLLDHDDGRLRRIRIDNLRVVLRDVDDLRVGRLDHDHLLAGRRRGRLDLLLRAGLERTFGVRILPQALDAVEHRRAIRRERRAEARGPVQLLGHELHDGRKQRHRDEVRFEALDGRRILQLGALQRSVRSEPRVQRDDLGRLGGTEEHLRQQLIRIQRDGSEQAVEISRRRDRRRFARLRRRPFVTRQADDQDHRRCDEMSHVRLH